jgi:hypothetical protein
MASPSSRQNLIDYCLRQLGQPVLEINIDDDQIEDRIDEAFQFYREYHFDAIELTYVSIPMAQSVMTISGVNAVSFTVGETLTGTTSGAKTVILSSISANKLSTSSTSGTFTVGETITGSSSGQTSTVISFELGNIDAKYLTLNDSVVGVKSILPFSSRTRGIDLFDIRYQILLNDLYSLQSTDIIYYSQVKTQLQLINDLLVGIKPLQFNKHMNRLYVSMDWKTDISAGEYMVVECYRILDPNSFTDVYNDMFLKEYATALLKRQWGINLKKFEGVQLPGGVTLNGQRIYDEAIEEIKQLRMDADLRYQLPVEFFTG